MHSARSTLSRELRSFVAIGLACTAAFAVVYAGLRGMGVPALAANAAALALTMGANFEANRRWTFAAGDGPLGRQVGGYVVAYGLGVAASTAALAVLRDALGDPTGPLDAAAAVTAGLAATAVRFALLRTWVFHTDTRNA